MSKQPNSPQQGQQGQQRGQTGTRQPQQFASQIHGNMAVIASDGARIGEVDRVEGDRIRLARADWPNDGAPGASNHYLPLGQVRAIEGDSVRLAVSGEVAQREATLA